MDTVFLTKSSAMRSGYIIDTVSAFEMLKIFWPNAGLLFPTKLSAVGVIDSALRMLELSFSPYTAKWRMRSDQPPPPRRLYIIQYKG